MGVTNCQGMEAYNGVIYANTEPDKSNLATTNKLIIAINPTNGAVTSLGALNHGPELEGVECNRGSFMVGDNDGIYSYNLPGFMEMPGMSVGRSNVVVNGTVTAVSYNGAIDNATYNGGRLGYNAQPTLTNYFQPGGDLGFGTNSAGGLNATDGLGRLWRTANGLAVTNINAANVLMATNGLNLGSSTALDLSQVEIDCTTNGANTPLTFSGFINKNSLKYQSLVVHVQSTKGSVLTIVMPASTQTQGTFNVTNESVISIEYDPLQGWTNAICAPLW
jgi:hypothetical protein